MTRACTCPRSSPRADTEADGDPGRRDDRGRACGVGVWPLLSAGWWRQAGQGQWSLFHDLGRRSALLHRLRPWYGPVTAILADDNPGQPRDAGTPMPRIAPVFMSSPAITTRYCGTRTSTGRRGWSPMRSTPRCPRDEVCRFTFWCTNIRGLFAALIASLQHEQIDVYAHVDDTSRQDLFESAAGCRCPSRFRAAARAGERPVGRVEPGPGHAGVGRAGSR